MPKSKGEALITEDQKKRLKKAQDKFYAILKKHGFKDIEDITKPDRPLIEYHNNNFNQQRTIDRMAVREEYQQLVDDFTNSKDFDDICIIMTKHGNCKLSEADIREIWDLNTQQGWTERQIVKYKNKAKSTIHDLLEKLRKWMEIV